MNSLLCLRDDAPSSAGSAQWMNAYLVTGLHFQPCADKVAEETGAKYLCPH